MNQNPVSNINCIEHPEDEIVNNLLKQFEEKTGKKVEVCDKCKPVVYELIMFLFQMILEEENKALFKEVENDNR